MADISAIPGITGSTLELFRAAGMGTIEALLERTVPQVFAELDRVNAGYDVPVRVPSIQLVEAWQGSGKVLLRKIEEVEQRAATVVSEANLRSAGIDVSSMPMAQVVEDDYRRPAMRAIGPKEALPSVPMRPDLPTTRPVETPARVQHAQPQLAPRSVQLTPEEQAMPLAQPELPEIPQEAESAEAETEENAAPKVQKAKKLASGRKRAKKKRRVRKKPKEFGELPEPREIDRPMDRIVERANRPAEASSSAPETVSASQPTVMPAAPEESLEERLDDPEGREGEELSAEESPALQVVGKPPFESDEATRNRKASPNRPAVVDLTKKEPVAEPDWQKFKPVESLGPPAEIDPERRNRGMSHPESGMVRKGAFATVFLPIIAGLCIVGLLVFMTLRGFDKEVHAGIGIALLAMIPVCLFTWLAIGTKPRCRLCGQRLFVSRNCHKHVSAHKSVFGYAFAAAWKGMFGMFRCMYCGTRFRLKD